MFACDQDDRYVGENSGGDSFTATTWSPPRPTDQHLKQGMLICPVRAVGRLSPPIGCRSQTGWVKTQKILVQ
jgi:hypothetical protein